MECENKVKGEQGCDRLQFFLSILIVAAIFTHATQASFDLLRAVKKVHVYVSVVDILLGLAFLLWIVRRIARKDFRLPCVPLAAWAAVIWMGLSLIPTLKGGSLAKLPLEKRGIMEILQFIEYFIIGFVLFVELFRNAKWRRWAVAALWSATAVTLVVALWQYARGIGVMDVRGAWFDNRNSLGAFLALAVPLLWTAGIFSKSWLARAGGLAIAILALCVCLSGGAFVAISLGIIIGAALRGGWVSGATIVGWCLIVFVLFPNLPRANASILIDSLALYKDKDSYGVFGDVVPKIQENAEKVNMARLDKAMEGLPLAESDFLDERETCWKWQQRYTEWQAAMNMVATSPIFGVGVGSYQTHVNSFYGSERFGPMPKYRENLMEPDAFGGIAIWGATAGMPFVLILMALALGALKRAATALWGKDGEPSDRPLAAGVVAALSVLPILCLFTNPLVRGVGITLAIVLAISYALSNAHSCVEFPIEEKE
jgi:hypothetical protein